MPCIRILIFKNFQIIKFPTAINKSLDSHPKSKYNVKTSVDNRGQRKFVQTFIVITIWKQ